MRHAFSSVAALLLLAGAVAPVDGASVARVHFEEMARRSAVVFEGRVTDVSSRWNAEGDAIETLVSFDVLDVVKGRHNGRSMTLRFLGGRVGEVEMSVSDAQLPVPGEHGVYFVRSRDESAIHPLYGWSQGHFLAVDDPQNAVHRVLSVTAEPVLSVAPQSDKGPARSNGVAAGVKVGPASRFGEALTLRDFKQRIVDTVTQSQGSTR